MKSTTPYVLITAEMFILIFCLGEDHPPLPVELESEAWQQSLKANKYHVPDNL